MKHRRVQRAATRRLRNSCERRAAGRAQNTSCILLQRIAGRGAHAWRRATGTGIVTQRLKRRLRKDSCWGEHSIRAAHANRGSHVLLYYPLLTCFPSSHGHGLVVMKNWLPFEFGPEFAIESRPGNEWETSKFSSSNLLP